MKLVRGKNSLILGDILIIVCQPLVACLDPAVHGATDCSKKKISVSVAVPPAPARVPSQRPLAPSVASVTSVARVIMK